jgi:hypothetical protein
MKANTAASRIKAVLLPGGAVFLLLFMGVVIGLITALVGSFVYLVFLFPVLMGYLSGYYARDVVRVAKITRAGQLLLLSALMAVVIYGSFHYCRYIFLQVKTSMEIFSGLSSALEDENFRTAQVVLEHSLKEETGRTGFAGYMLYRAESGFSIGRFYSQNRLTLTSAFAWLYWLLELGIIFWITYRMTGDARRLPHCEACGQQLGKERHIGGTVPSNESLLLDLLERRDLAGLGELLVKDAGLPSVELYMRRCDSCGQSTSLLTVRRAHLGTKGVVLSDLSQASLPPREGRLFLQQLHFEVE